MTMHYGTSRSAGFFLLRDQGFACRRRHVVCRSVCRRKDRRCRRRSCAFRHGAHRRPGRNGRIFYGRCSRSLRRGRSCCSDCRRLFFVRLILTQKIHDQHPGDHRNDRGKDIELYCVPPYGKGIAPKMKIPVYFKRRKYKCKNCTDRHHGKDIA